MRNYLICFFKRGLMTAVGGPVILGIVYKALGMSGVIAALSTEEVFTGIWTSAVLAFIAGGISVVYQIERLDLLRATLLHALVLYGDYILIYLFNGWLESSQTSVLCFTGIYIVGYVLVWCFVYGLIRISIRKMNQKLHMEGKS